jgi:hypothetical protein
MDALRKGTVLELRNLETELRLRALEGKLETPPEVRNAETPEAIQKAWVSFTLVVFYKRQLGTSPV